MGTPEHDRLWYVADRVCLGEPEHQHALTLVGPDGSHRWMLAEPDHWCRECPLPEPPEHEKTGRLPAGLLQRVYAAPVRCGASRADGQPCRNVVPRLGRCHHHRIGGA